ncbi:hypothetical protein B0H14DRAFT_3507676 [Mycena olivaceomarginata]|nr:hypothetical protein B0H14DRAFT_3507676 [Mycena olivaceomarginata]
MAEINPPPTPTSSRWGSLKGPRPPCASSETLQSHRRHSHQSMPSGFLSESLRSRKWHAARLRASRTFSPDSGGICSRRIQWYPRKRPHEHGSSNRTRVYPSPTGRSRLNARASSLLNKNAPGNSSSAVTRPSAEEATHNRRTITSDLNELAVPATARAALCKPCTPVARGTKREVDHPLYKATEQRPKPNVDPPAFLTPLVFTAAAVQPTGLADLGDNLAGHPPPFDDLGTMIHPPIPFSNVWKLKSAQGVHLGLRGKATADRRVRNVGDRQLRTSLQGGAFPLGFV